MEKHSGGAQQNSRKFVLEDIERAVRFVTMFAEERALTIPGRVPSKKSSDPRIRLLPAVENRTSIWRKYRKSFGGGGVRWIDGYVIASNPFSTIRY